MRKGRKRKPGTMRVITHVTEKEKAEVENSAA